MRNKLNQLFGYDLQALDVTDEWFDESLEEVTRLAKIFIKDERLYPTVVAYTRKMNSSDKTFGDINVNVFPFVGYLGTTAEKEVAMMQLGAKLRDLMEMPVALFMFSEAEMFHVKPSDKTKPPAKTVLIVVGRTVGEDRKIVTTFGLNKSQEGKLTLNGDDMKVDGEECHTHLLDCIIIGGTDTSIKVNEDMFRMEGLDDDKK